MQSNDEIYHRVLIAIFSLYIPKSVSYIVFLSCCCIYSQMGQLSLWSFSFPLQTQRLATHEVSFVNLSQLASQVLLSAYHCSNCMIVLLILMDFLMYLKSSINLKRQVIDFVGLLKVARLLRFLCLIYEACQKFTTGKIIYLMRSIAKALRVFFLFPFELCVHNLLHNWLFTKPNSVQCSVSLLILPYILFYSIIFAMGESIHGTIT